MILSIINRLGAASKQIISYQIVFTLVIWVGALCIIEPVLAHGEQNQEPFLRMRTIQWYDLKWSLPDGSPAEQININDEVIITGKFRAISDWPQNVPPLTMAYLSTAGPGSVFTKQESYINGIPMIQSTDSLEFNTEYTFKLVMKARWPGKYHLHPTLMVQGGGPIVGPGKYITNVGDSNDFVLPVTTLTGQKIPDLDTWGLSTVVTWHALWFVIAIIWLLWWLRRPFLMPRYMALKKGREDLLITKSDNMAAVILLVVTMSLVIGGYQWAEAKFPQTAPLQGAVMKIPPVKQAESQVDVYVEKAFYDVPGRTMKGTLRVTNNTLSPVQLGELSTANIRFVNENVQAAKDNVDPGYPEELVNFGLTVSDSTPILPGKTRNVDFVASDLAWETERLAGLIHDPVNRMGALLHFYDNLGERHITEVNSSILPVFVEGGLATSAK